MSHKALNLPFNFSSVTSLAKWKYERFFELTNDKNIHLYAKGANLSHLTKLATTCRNVIQICNPVGCSKDLFPSERSSKSVVEWELQHLSKVKERLAKAIELKRNYYQHTIIGVIKQLFLRLFGLWNNGDTPSVMEAEDFLIFWDSKAPLFKGKDGKYFPRQDFPHPKDVDTSHFFNYTPRQPRKTYLA